MINALIIDDEMGCVETLTNMLKWHCPQVKVLGSATHLETGRKMVYDLEPNLLFLDIRMPEGSGFDLLQSIRSPRFSVVFVTAFQEYAVNAFKFGALDYLLKPIVPDDLIRSVDKAERNFREPELKTQKETEGKIVLATSDSIYLVNPSEIVHCQSFGSYTDIHLFSGKKITVSKNLKVYDEQLTPSGFFRIHRSHLINLSFFHKFDYKGGGFVTMMDGSRLPVASRKKDQLLTWITSR